MYKDMQYEKLLQMMEMALGPRPKHVLKPVEVRESDLAGEERHPGPVLEDEPLKQAEEQEQSQEEGEDEEQDDGEGEEEEAEEDEEEEEEEELKKPRPSSSSNAGPRAAKPPPETASPPKINTWDGVPSPATKENARTESPEEALPKILFFTKAQKALNTLPKNPKTLNLKNPKTLKPDSTCCCQILIMLQLSHGPCLYIGEANRPERQVQSCPAVEVRTAPVLATIRHCLQPMTYIFLVEVCMASSALIN